MNNKQLYDKAFMEALGLDASQLPSLKYQDVQSWDSVGHMSLMGAIEDAFDIMMDTDDIIDFSSYEKGMEILTKNYDVTF